MYTDGRVGAVIDNGNHFITTHTQKYIPLPQLTRRETRLRADCRYGEDDPLQWPQLFSAEYPYFAAIPRLPEGADPLRVIWWDLTKADFTPDLDGYVMGLGTLRSSRLGEFERLVTEIQQRLRDLRPTRTWVVCEEGAKRRILRLSVVLNDYLTRLTSLVMTFRHLQRSIVNFQRCFLELRGAMDWVEIYQPMMDGTRRAATTTAKTVGAFVRHLQVAEEFTRAGLPFWLIHEFGDLVETRVDALVEIRQPEGFICCTDNIPKSRIIFEGRGDDKARYAAMAAHVNSFRRYPDPFEHVNISSSSPSSGPPPPSTSATPGPIRPPPRQANKCSPCKLSSQTIKLTFLTYPFHL